MKAIYTERLSKSYLATTPRVQTAFNKQVKLLIKNIRHPSLHAKKYDEVNGVWQARINRDWRFYFTIKRNIYYICLLYTSPSPRD